MRKKSKRDDEEKIEYKKGLWTVEEDKILMDYVKAHGKGHWNRIAKKTGLRRCGKSCRLRWMNYLSPNVKKGNFTEQEEDLIIRLHKLLGNRWSLIAKRVPGRTDNQVKNYWNTHLSKKLEIKHETQKSINGDNDQKSFAYPIKVSEEKCMNVNHSRNEGTDEKISSEVNNTNQYQIQTFSEDNRPQHQETFVPVIGGEGNNQMMNSLWVHEDELEFSTLTNIMDFVDGYCF